VADFAEFLDSMQRRRAVETPVPSTIEIDREFDSNGSDPTFVFLNGFCAKSTGTGFYGERLAAASLDFLGISDPSQTLGERKFWEFSVCSR